MKKVVFFLSVFFYIYSVKFKGFLFSTDQILLILGVFTLILNPNDLKKLLYNKRAIRFLGLTFILLILGVFGSLQNTGKPDYSFINNITNGLLSIFSAYFIVKLAEKAYKQITIPIIIQAIIILAIVQTLISIVFFLRPELYYNYLSYLDPNEMQSILSRLTGMERRFFGIGSNFFGGAVKFSIAFFGILILPLISNSKLAIKKSRYLLAVFFIVIGGILTARTAFIGIALGITMITLLKAENIFSFIFLNVKYIIIGTFVITLMMALGTIFLDASRIVAISNWVFEAFINYQEGSGLETSSTNTLQGMYQTIPSSLNTWLFGDGKMMDPQGVGYYMHTDVGYLRLIFYFGLPATLYYVYLQFKYTKIISENIVSKPIRYFLYTLAIWVIIINFKGWSNLTSYYSLFLIFSIFETKKTIK